MAICRVLSCSPNLDLAQLRAAVLRSADCDVIVPVSEEDALRLMQGHSFDVLLICYDYSEQAGKEICDAFKKSNPKGRIIVLRKSHRDPSCHDEAKEVLHALDGPGALIRAVIAA